MSSQTSPGQFFLFGFFLILLIFGLDQYTKWMVMETMLRKGTEVPEFLDWLMTRRPLPLFLDQRETYNTVVLTPFLNFVMVWNTGISFGLFNSESQAMPLILTGVSLLVSMLMLIWMALTPRRMVLVALALVIGGAVGNALDRIRFGAVVDFVDVHAADLHWPAFNLADSAIVLGAILMIIDVMFVPQSGSGKLR